MMWVVKSECFRIDSGVRQVYIMLNWLFNVYMDTAIKEVKMGMGRRLVGFRRREESLDWLASCIQMTWFCVVRRRKT